VYATLGGRRQIVLAAEAAQEVDLAIESGRASLPPDERPPRPPGASEEKAAPEPDSPNRVR